MFNKLEPDLQRSLLFFVLVLLSGIAMSWLIPPIQSPDESSHLGRAYMISKGRLTLDPPNEDLRSLKDKYSSVPGIAEYIERTLRRPGGVSGMVDENLMAYMEAYMALPGVSSQVPKSEALTNIKSMRWSGSERIHIMPGTGYYLPLIYLPQATALWIGRSLDLTIEWSYRITRLLTLIVSLSLVFVSCHLIRPNPATMAILILPMSIYQFLSPTIDGLSTAIVLLSLALFVSMMQVGSSYDRQRFLLLLGLILILGTTRNHLACLVVLLFVLAWHERSTERFCWSIIATLVILAWNLYALQSVNDQRILRELSTSQIILYYLHHPGSLIQVIFNTVTNVDVLDFYQKSFIGILGALDIPLIDAFYAVLWILLFVCFVCSIRPSDVAAVIQIRWVLVSCSLLSSVLIFTALLLTWSPHPAVRIEGVQGRYFTIPAIMLAYGLGDLRPPSSLAVRWLGRIAALAVAPTSMVAIGLAMYGRYPQFWTN